MRTTPVLSLECRGKVTSAVILSGVPNTLMVWNVAHVVVRFAEESEISFEQPGIDRIYLPTPTNLIGRMLRHDEMSFEVQPGITDPPLRPVTFDLRGLGVVLDGVGDPCGWK